MNDIRIHLAVALTCMGTSRARRRTSHRHPKLRARNGEDARSIASHLAKSLECFDILRGDIIYRPEDIVLDITEALANMPEPVYQRAVARYEDASTELVEAVAALLESRYTISPLEPVMLNTAGGHMNFSVCYDREKALVAKHGVNWRERHVRTFHTLS